MIKTMYNPLLRTVSRLLLLSFLFETCLYQAPSSYANPSSVSVYDHNAQGTSPEAPSNSIHLPLLAQEQAVQSILPRAWRTGKLSTDAAGYDLLRTSLKVTPVGENLSFEARGGERVRFHYERDQWRAEVLSRIGGFFRQSLLPVVCSLGEDVTSSIEVLSNYPSWQRQRRIHVLDRSVCPTLGEVVYLGELGLKGGEDVSHAVQVLLPLKSLATMS
ncbi:MAG: hypothetical protein AAF400_02855 [Bacteroidota bacterium]